jgi:hypothetical protein
MTTDKHDPWALLREARVVVYEYGPLDEDIAEPDLLARIDAALAEHADSATPVVEWKTEMGLHATTVNGVNIAVFAMAEDDKWTAALHVAEPFNTLDEAKSAAIAAARGMR